MKIAIILTFLIICSPFFAKIFLYERGHLGCIKSMKTQKHVLKGQYAETTLVFPIAFLADRYAYNLFLEKQSGRSSSFNLRLRLDTHTMKPACLSKDYKGNGAGAKRFISIGINKGSPEALHYKFLQNTYKYSEYIKTDKNGFRIYKDIRDAIEKKKGIGVRELFLPSDGMFDYPVQIRCNRSMRRPVSEDNKNCNVYTLLGDHIYLEYLVHLSQLPDLKELDKKIKAFLSTLIKKQDVFDSDKIVKDLDKTCEGKVNVNLGNVSLKLSREYTFVRPSKVRFYGMDGPKYNCEIDTISDIDTILFEPFGQKEQVIIERDIIGKTVRKKSGIPTQDFLDKHQYKELDNGTLLYYFEHSHTYLVPSEVMPTHDDVPIYINCRAKPIKDPDKPFDYEVCKTRYIHPTGVSVYHSMYRRFLEPYEEIDRVTDVYNQLNSD